MSGETRRTYSEIVTLKKLVGEDGGFLKAYILPWPPGAKVRVTIERLDEDEVQEKA